MPNWVTQSSTDFTSGPAHAPVAAGQTLADGFVDYNGNTWGTNDGTGANAGKGSLYVSSGDGNGFLHNLLLQSTASLNQRVDFYFPGSELATSNVCHVGRYNGGNYFLSWLDNNGISFATVSAGAVSVFATVSFTCNQAHNFCCRFDVYTTATGVTSYDCYITDTTTNTVVFTHSSPGLTAANVQGSGLPGLTYFPQYGYQGASFTRVDIFTDVLVPGSISFISDSSAGVNMLGADPASTDTLTRQWHRSTTSGFTPSSSTAIAGQTALALSDTTVPSDTTYFYQLVWTDAASGMTSASNQLLGYRTSKKLTVGFLGDSETQGYGLAAGQDPGTQFGIAANQLGTHLEVTVVNRAISGYNSANFTPNTSDYQNAKAAFIAAGAKFVLYMIGANDAITPYTAAQYIGDVSATANDLVAAGITVVLNYPMQTPPGYNSRTEASAALLQTYYPAIDALCNGTTIIQGDKRAATFFMENIAELQTADHLHVTPQGAVSLATMWLLAFVGPSGLSASSPASSTGKIINNGSGVFAN